MLGERAQPAETIRAGAETATIEAVFDAPRKSPVATLLQEHGIMLEDGLLVVRRELVRGGRGRVFLNDANTTLALLERLGETLVEVHGQHEHQALLRSARHLDLLDAFAGLGILRDRLRQRHDEWRSVSAELEALRVSARDQVARTTQYRETMAEIDAARLRPGRGGGASRGAPAAHERRAPGRGRHRAYRELYDDPASAVERAGRAASLLRDLARIDPEIQPTVQALETALVHLDETARALRSYRDGVVFDPPRLDAIERRIDEIGRLKRKYGESVDAVLTLRARLETDLEGLARAGEDEGRLAERVERLRTELVTRATDLAERRDQAVGRLETSVLAELAALDLEGAVFQVRLARERAGQGELAVGPEAWRLGPKGVDQAEFFFSGNAGEEARPLARIASGGELSRTMLALKVVLAATDAVPVLIFDEVDVGIGGKTADTVGKKLRQVSRARQVLCVTHLPQIAAYADQHFRVEKREDDGRTATTVAALVRNDRVREVARMLGGRVRHRHEPPARARAHHPGSGEVRAVRTRRPAGPA